MNSSKPVIFLVQEMRPRNVESIQELIEQNFDVYGYNYLSDSFHEPEILKKLRF